MYTFENIFLDCLVKLAASFICGLCLGFERKKRFHTVGIRTLILISISSTVMCMMSTLIAEKSGVKGDPTRIAAAVVTGIGFLGGGAIIHQGMNIRGLTSAAIIWTASALGLACGIGAYFVAGITLVIAILSLVILGTIEGKLFPAEKSKNLTIVFEESEIDLELIKKAIAEVGFIQRDMNMTESLEKERIILQFTIKTPCEYNLHLLTKRLRDTGKLIKISISDD